MVLEEVVVALVVDGVTGETIVEVVEARVVHTPHVYTEDVVLGVTGETITDVVEEYFEVVVAAVVEALDVVHTCQALPVALAYGPE